MYYAASRTDEAQPVGSVDDGDSSLACNGQHHASPYHTSSVDIRADLDLSMTLVRIDMVILATRELQTSPIVSVRLGNQCLRRIVVNSMAPNVYARGIC